MPTCFINSKTIQNQDDPFPLVSRIRDRRNTRTFPFWQNLERVALQTSANVMEQTRRLHRVHSREPLIVLEDKKKRQQEQENARKQEREEAKAGEANGAKYELIGHTATLVVDVK